MKSPIQLFTFLAILLATATVAAQVYKWVDKDGKVQYTDTPPPPGATKAEPKKVDTPAGPASAPAPAGAAPKSLDERARDFDKRKNEAAEKAKKDSESQQNAEVDAENCRDARTALIDLESGRPINRSNDKGERVFITDEQRQAEISKARAMVAASCKG